MAVAAKVTIALDEPAGLVLTMMFAGHVMTGSVPSVTSVTTVDVLLARMGSVTVEVTDAVLVSRPTNEGLTRLVIWIAARAALPGARLPREKVSVELAPTE